MVARMVHLLTVQIRPNVARFCIDLRDLIGHTLNVLVTMLTTIPVATYRFA